MPSLKTLALLCILYAALLPTRAHATEARTPALLWDRFVQALETGRMEEAYACFSPLSREAYSFRQFCTDHHPLTVAYEAILVTPTRSEFQISGDLAELRFIAPVAQDIGGHAAPAAPQGLLVTATMVREDGAWYLVPPSRHGIARLEAEARNLLRHLTHYAPGIRDALERGSTLDTDAIQLQNGQLLSEAGVAHVLREYDLRTIDRNGETLLQAWPKHTDLRAFSIDARGTIQRPGQARHADTFAKQGTTPPTPDAIHAASAPASPAPHAATHDTAPAPPGRSDTAHTTADATPSGSRSHAPASGRVRFHDLPPPSAEVHQPMPDPLAHVPVDTGIVPPLDAPEVTSAVDTSRAVSAAAPSRPAMPDTALVPPPPPTETPSHTPARAAPPPIDLASIPMPEHPSVTRAAPSRSTTDPAPPEAPDLRGYLDNIDLPELDIDLPMLGDVPPPPRDTPNLPPKARVRVQEASIRLPHPDPAPQRDAPRDTHEDDDRNVSVGNLRPRPEDFMDAEWVRPVAVIGSPEVTDASYPGNLPVEDTDTRGTVSTLVPPLSGGDPLPRNEITTTSSDPWDVLDENTRIDIPGLLMPEDLP